MKPGKAKRAGGMLVGASASLLTHLAAAAALAWVVSVPADEEREDEPSMEVVLEEWEPEFEEPVAEDEDEDVEEEELKEEPPPEEEEEDVEEELLKEEPAPEAEEPPVEEEPPPQEAPQAEEPPPEEEEPQEEEPPPPAEAIAVELQEPEETEEEPVDASFVAEVAQRADVETVAAETTLEDAQAPDPDEEASAPENEERPDAPDYLASESEVLEDDIEGAMEDEGRKEEFRATAEQPASAPEPAPAAQAARAAREEVKEVPPPEPALNELAMMVPTAEGGEAPLVPELPEERPDESPESEALPEAADELEAQPGEADETLGPARLFGRDMDAYREVFEERDAERAEEIAEARASKRRRLLSGWQGDSAKLRASLENFAPHVQVGNHTQVNAASAAHATMIARMHRRYVHPQWAEGFVRRIESNLSLRHPLNNLQLMTQLEIVLDAESGGVVDVVRLQPSGNEFFDGQAIIVAWNIESVAPVPEEVISHDGRVYIHWEFSRGPRLCGTFGARIFKLTEPGSGRQIEAP